MSKHLKKKVEEVVGNVSKRLRGLSRFRNLNAELIEELVDAVEKQLEGDLLKAFKDITYHAEWDSGRLTVMNKEGQEIAWFSLFSAGVYSEDMSGVSKKPVFSLGGQTELDIYDYQRWRSTVYTQHHVVIAPELAPKKWGDVIKADPQMTVE